MTKVNGILRGLLAWATVIGALVLLTGVSSTALAQSQSNDATLSNLTLSGVDFGTFASDTTSYSASVAYRQSETTVTPTVNHSGASYVIRENNIVDSDGVIPLTWSDTTTITVEVTAEDGNTTKSYTVEVYRWDYVDTRLSALSLSGVDFGRFRSNETSYTADVAYSLTETTVTPTLQDTSSSYVITLGGVEDTDGVISLAAGSNVIAVVITGEDGQTTRTYTVTVTRAATLSTDATLEYLKLSDIDIGSGLNRAAYAQNKTSFTANVYNSVSATTVTPTVNHPFATYVVKLGGVTDSDGDITLAVGSNVITVEVTAEDGQSTQTYTATVNRATSTAATTGELSTDNPPVNLRALSISSTDVIYSFNFPRNRGLTGYASQRYEHDGTSFVSSGSDSALDRGYGTLDFGGSRVSFGDTNVESGKQYKWVVQFKNSQGEVVIESSVTVRIPGSTNTELSSDATLSSLTLSGLVLKPTGVGTIACGGFSGSHLSYAASISDTVSQTTVSPTVSHSGAGYVTKLGGVEDTDGVISLGIGNNVITVEVTAEDGVTTKTYNVTVRRATGLSTDATLSSLNLIRSGQSLDLGFASDITSYSATVANGVNRIDVNRSLNHSGAACVVKDDGVATDDYITLNVGSNVITVEVTAEDGITKKTYTVTVTRLQPALTVSGSTTTNYAENGTGSVATYAATGAPSGATVTWSLSGDDSDDFSISSAGVLTFASSPNYESPSDSNTDNVYSVTIEASATDRTTGTLDVTVTVTDVNERVVLSGG